MQALFEPASSANGSAPLWRSPSAWLQKQKLNRNFWVFFTAAFFFDAGFSVYFFLFNLYLLDSHFHERSIGIINGALTLGSLVGTLPAGLLARKIGLRRLLAICFISASLLNGARAFWMQEPAQITLAFLAGMAMCCWGVCYLPAVARLTTEENRTSAFSLIYSVSIGTSILGGIVSGYLPVWCKSAGLIFQAAEIKRLILVIACCIAVMSLLPLSYLRIPDQLSEETGNIPQSGRRWLQILSRHPFLVRFLPLTALWAAVLAAFTPFANIFLAQELHMPLPRIGLIFSATQALQLSMGLLLPIIVRALGLINGIAATQIVAGIALFAMAVAGKGAIAVALYLIFTAAQWASSPGLYNLLMNQTPDSQRSTAAAMTLFANALAGSLATAGAGALFARFGYKPALIGIAGVALTTAILFRIIIVPRRHSQLTSTGVACLKESKG
jgi:predicted MFS family arabinose efflux permease